MKNYTKPEIETLKFAIANDVICTSGGGNIDDGGAGNGDGTGENDDVGIQS